MAYLIFEHQRWLPNEPVRRQALYREGFVRWFGSRKGAVETQLPCWWSDQELVLGLEPSRWAREGCWLGRRFDNAIRIWDPRIAQRLATFRHQEEGWHLRDNVGRASLQINDRPLPMLQPRRLRGGEAIRICDVAHGEPERLIYFYEHLPPEIIARISWKGQPDYGPAAARDEPQIWGELRAITQRQEMSVARLVELVDPRRHPGVERVDYLLAALSRPGVALTGEVDMAWLLALVEASTPGRGVDLGQLRFERWSRPPEVLLASFTVPDAQQKGQFLIDDRLLSRLETRRWFVEEARRDYDRLAFLLGPREEIEQALQLLTEHLEQDVELSRDWALIERLGEIEEQAHQEIADDLMHPQREELQALAYHCALLGELLMGRLRPEGMFLYLIAVGSESWRQNAPYPRLRAERRQRLASFLLSLQLPGGEG